MSKHDLTLKTALRSALVACSVAALATPALAQHPAGGTAGAPTAVSPGGGHSPAGTGGGEGGEGGSGGATEHRAGGPMGGTAPGAGMGMQPNVGASTHSPAGRGGGEGGEGGSGSATEHRSPVPHR